MSQVGLGGLENFQTNIDPPNFSIDQLVENIGGFNVKLENREYKDEQRATEAKKRDREKNFWKNFLYSDSGKMN